MDDASGEVKAFNRNDEQFLEAFALFCGLGIQNTQMYEAVERAMAKQEVTLEVSSTFNSFYSMFLQWNNNKRNFIWLYFFRIACLYPAILTL